MKSLYLNNNGDLEFDSSMNLKMVDKIDEVKQRIKIDLNVNEGEWFLNVNLGLPWIDMLSNNAPEENYKKEVLKLLNNDSAVEKVNKITVNFDRQNRDLNIDFEVTINGESYSESVVIV